MTVDSSGEVILATGSYDHTIKLWNAKTGVSQKQFTLQTHINALEITPDKQHMAAAGFGVICKYDINSKKDQEPATFYDGLSKNVTAIGFQEDGKWMYTGGEDKKARVWDLRSRSFQCQRIFEVLAPVNCVRLHPNQTEIIVGDQTGYIHIWDLTTDHNEQLLPEADSSIQDIAIDPSGKLMAAVNNKGNCYIWNLTKTGDEPTKINPKHMIHAHSRYALKCRFSSDGSLLVTTSADQTARVWRMSDFEQIQEMKAENQRWVWGAAFTVDCQYLVTGSSDGMARLWDVATGAVKREYSGHQKAVTALAFADEAI